MSAPLRKYSQKYFLSLSKQIWNPVRWKYWEIGEDSLKEKGETVSDRTVGVPKNARDHPETPIKGQLESDPPKGRVYDKKPFPAVLKAGKVYYWCACGYSTHQPFCDGSHKRVFDVRFRGKSIEGGNQRNVLHKPIKFEVDEDGEYWLCNCKQTNNKPFCDGTHQRDFVQEGKSVVTTI